MFASHAATKLAPVTVTKYTKADVPPGDPARLDQVPSGGAAWGGYGRPLHKTRGPASECGAEVNDPFVWISDRNR